MKRQLYLIFLILFAKVFKAQTCFQNPFDIYLSNPDIRMETYNGSVSGGSYSTGYTSTSHSSISSAFYTDPVSNMQIGNSNNGNFASCYNGFNYNIIKLGDDIANDNKSKIMFPLQNNFTIHFAVFMSSACQGYKTVPFFHFKQIMPSGSGIEENVFYNCGTYNETLVTNSIKRYDFVIDIINCSQTNCYEYEIETLDESKGTCGFCYAYIGIGPYTYNNQPYPPQKINDCNLSFSNSVTLKLSTAQTISDLKWYKDGINTPLCSYNCPHEKNVTDYGVYYAKYKINGCEFYEYFNVSCDNSEPEIINGLPCTNCIPSFSPLPGKSYVVSAWASQNNYDAAIITQYTAPKIKIKFLGAGNSELTPSQGTVNEFFPTGKIIDGWQKIEGEFFIPSNCVRINIELINIDEGSAQVFYDDIRIQPIDASMKSFVYDAVSLKLMAELDENNYATFYEYDEEGQLIRVKKETERGIMTIRESRSNTIKNKH